MYTLSHYSKDHVDNFHEKNNGGPEGNLAHINENDTSEGNDLDQEDKIVSNDDDELVFVDPGAWIAGVESSVPPNGIIGVTDIDTFPPNGIVGVTIVDTDEENFAKNETTHDLLFYDCDYSDDSIKWTLPPIIS